MRRLAFAVLVGAACQSPPSASAPASASASASASGTASASAPASASAKVVVVEAAQDMDAISQIRTERLKAKADGRVLVVYVGATWCDPCKKFKQELHSGNLDAKLSKITLLAFDADKDQDRLATVGYSFRFIPFVALPGADGQPTDSQEARGKGAAAWRELLGKLETWQANAPRR